MLELAFANGDPLDQVADLLVIACGDGDLEAPDSLVGRADTRLDGLLRRAAAEERFVAKPGQSLLAHTHGGLPAGRVALVGVGSPTGDATRALRTAAGSAARLASTVGATRAALAWSAGAGAAALEAAAEGAWLGSYRFDKYLTDERNRAPTLGSLTLCPPSALESDAARAALARARSSARAVERARDLVNEPAGVLTPTRIATLATEWGQKAGLSIQVLDRAACAKLGMGLFLAVAQGSQEEPRFIHLAWTPPGARRRLVLVGKGVTFDSGGLSLKTNEGMLDMKTDMAGAAAVLAATVAAGEEKLPVEVHALAACTENMPSGNSYKLGDVIRSLNGKTVEINNTDAEGRLTLADAITFGLRLRPDALLDFATLTGACMVALGPHIAGVMSNDDALATTFLSASEQAGEEMWRLPLPPRLGEQLKSEIADLKNTGERWGGALTAGLFLKEFVGDVPWAHVDIAGPASANKEHGHVGKGGTGFGVVSILNYLRRSAT
ncbi:MAG TPA: leucyl aminopeptidase [Polyangia bacterium]|jgi:leucyl aminopeptidase|nr:leucyl aminopeptidase [Polyangia bacterium]